MSLLADIVLLCEGSDSGPDVRLLEVTRQVVVAGGLEGAAFVSILPAGSKVELPSRIRIQRELARHDRVFAISDRDFLSTPLREDACRRAAQGDPRPYILSRHSIESYLLDPAFVQATLKLDTATLTDRLAAARYWEDVAQAVLRDVEYRVRPVRAKLRTPPPADREAAVRAVKDALAAMQQGRTPEEAPERVPQLIEDFAADLKSDGPSWGRVHGKELLANIETALRKDGSLPGGGILNRLLQHAERNLEPPPALVEELRAFLAVIL